MKAIRTATKTANVVGSHSGHRTTNQHACAESKRERERGVADGHDVALVKVREGVHADPVQRTGPPRDQKTDEPREENAGKTNDGDLGGQPARARDTLSPHQAMGASFELSSGERRPPKNPYDARRDDNKYPEPSSQGAVAVKESSRGGPAVFLRLARGDRRVVDVNQVWPRDRKSDGDDGQGTERDRGLCTELEPGKADHETTLKADNCWWSTSRACLI